MDENTLNDLNESNIDNSRLEEIMRSDITPEMQKEFLKTFKESRLYMPVTFSENIFEGIEDAKEGDILETEGPSGFNIMFLEDGKGNKAVPLFTSEEIIRSVNVKTSMYVLYMSDLAYLLSQTDKYSIIAINPFTEFDLNMPVDAFLKLFEDEEKLQIEDIKNDKMIEILNSDFNDEVMHDFFRELIDSVMIVPCVENDDGRNFVMIWNSEKKPFLPLFSDMDEFKKIFENYSGDVYPDAFQFTDLAMVCEGDFVINPASVSLELNFDMFDFTESPKS